MSNSEPLSLTILKSWRTLKIFATGTQTGRKIYPALYSGGIKSIYQLSHVGCQKTNKPISMLFYPISRHTIPAQGSARVPCRVFDVCCLCSKHWMCRAGTGKYCGKSYPEGARRRSLENIYLLRIIPHLLSVALQTLFCVSDNLCFNIAKQMKTHLR